MTIKQKIWSIPLIAILIFSIGMAITQKFSSYTYALLQRAGAIHYPFLHEVQSLNASLTAIQGNFTDALDTRRDLGIVRAREQAKNFRNIAAGIAKIEGKEHISKEILQQFDAYFPAAENAASILIDIKAGDAASEMDRMIVTLRTIKNTLEQEHVTARRDFEKGLDDSRNNIRRMLWVSIISAVTILLGLAIISYRLISSILTNLEFLRVGAYRVAKGDFSERIPEQGKDELALVIQTFNSMSEELQVALRKHVEHREQIEALNQDLEKRVVIRTAELAEALEEAKKANAAVAYMADHDTLTGLLSRRRFQEEYERWGKYALRHERPMALMFIDLDKFKAINDTYGHLGGDTYLTAVADTLKKTLRSTDYVCRWGGDEFAVLLPEATAAAACEVADKLTRSLNRTQIGIADQSLYASASIGIASLPEHTVDINELSAFSDAAMYEAKNAGRGCFRLYSASNNELEHLEEHTRWAERIRRALETDQFQLFYQPLLNLKTGETHEYEVLLRMEDKSGEYISPELFLASAERFDLSISIDRMVIRKAVRKIAALRAKKKTLQLSLNLSSSTLDDSNVMEYVSGVIKDANIDPASLSVEISEATVLQNMSRVLTLCTELNKLGCRLILDDADGQLASFSHFAPAIRAIKIQGELMRNLHQADNHARIVALCKKCRKLNIAVVAKSIEDPSLLGELYKIGVDYAQGFAIGRPMESLDETGADT